MRRCVIGDAEEEPREQTRPDTAFHLRFRGVALLGAQEHGDHDLIRGLISVGVSRLKTRWLLTLICLLRRGCAFAHGPDVVFELHD